MERYQELSHRKAKCRLHITDRQGQPLKNARLKLRQQNHEFLFGCGAFDALPYANQKGNESPDTLSFYKDRVEKWLALFNYGTIPVYWGQFEPVEGSPATENRMNASRFLKEKGVTLKGHPLCWHTVCADWLLAYDNPTILKKQLDRITRDVSAFQGVIDIWDVINEVVIMPDFDRYDNAVTRICKDLGRVGLVKEVFAAAKAANPEAELLINDFNTSVSYEILIDGCLNAGVPISTIGIQSHQHQGYWGADKLYDVLERFSRFGLPIHFTENTMVSGPLIPPEITDLNDFRYEDNASDPAGEARQKKQLEEMYRILFSHPQVKAITAWDFADGAWLNAPSGLIRKDNSTKPAYDGLKQLIKGEWWTECELCTDDNGFTEAEGFKGNYSLESESGCASLTLTTEIAEQQIVL